MKPADYIAAAKRKLRCTSDRELGLKLRIPRAQQTIAKAKNGNMSDPLALDIAEVLKIDPGEVLLVARAEREQEPRVKAALLAYVGKVVAPVLALVAASGHLLLLQPDVELAGGEGGN